MKTRRDPRFDWMLALLAFVLVTAFTGCQTGEVVTKTDRLIDDYVAARQDGKLDPAEIAQLDRDAGDLDDARQRAPAFSLPPTGNPWIDAVGQILFPLGAAATAGYAAHKHTMTVRDRLAEAKAPEGTNTPTPTA